jgi:hypothetical protein
MTFMVCIRHYGLDKKEAEFQLKSRSGLYVIILENDYIYLEYMFYVKIKEREGWRERKIDIDQ